MATAVQSYISIHLTPDEVCMGANHAVIRRRAKLAGEREDRPQNGRSTWDNEVEGSCAEQAFCKHHRIYWEGVAGLRARDSALMEIRWTLHYDKGGLIRYPKDKDDVRLVLMDGYAPDYRIIGWLPASEAKHPDYWVKESGYFMVPRRLLRVYTEGIYYDRKTNHA